MSVTAALAAMLSSACATPHATRTTYAATAGVGVASTVVGIGMLLQGVILFDCDPDCPDPLPQIDPDVHLAGKILLATGLVSIFAGIIGIVNADADERRQREAANGLAHEDYEREQAERTRQIPRDLDSTGHTAADTVTYAHGEGTNVLGEVPGYDVPVTAQTSAFANSMFVQRLRLADGLAFDLQRIAEQAARAGDCATVREMDKHVLALDPEIHRVMFAATTVLHKCLGTTPSITPLEPPP